MKHKIFIDGREGTTGLKIFERFVARADIELLHLAETERKDLRSRLARMSEADISFLCLPDEASREIVAAADEAGVETRVIDASGAFRTSPAWVYGLPELTRDQGDKIKAAPRVAVPGCHPTGFLLIARPLIDAGVLAADYPFSCCSVTGYSGGGKKMIAEYERRSDLKAPRQYGLSQAHKHLPEFESFSGAKAPVLFNPIVSDYYSGMLVSVPLHRRLFQQKARLRELYELFAARYEGRPLIKVIEPGHESDDGFLAADAMAGRNDLEILFCGQGDRIVIAARYDNLGKGASGAAIQCMNLMLGLPEAYGLSD
ncbi:MAG: N-acetyl-gamma-glutamyl-phosphate reductase [Clostridiales Family XIII bacterium]|jgi:N-acetyl-gamma-glutamyl-phosphate reductase|nr:N-acetyl-gamma-glutamyl-phosphate reductase [Clostridiales Family XIII bacterium]